MQTPNACKIGPRPSSCCNPKWRSGSTGAWTCYFYNLWSCLQYCLTWGFIDQVTGHHIDHVSIGSHTPPSPHRVLHKFLSTYCCNSFLIWEEAPHLVSRIVIATFQGIAGCNWTTRNIKYPALVQGETWPFKHASLFECIKLWEKVLCVKCCSPAATTKATQF